MADARAALAELRARVAEARLYPSHGEIRLPVADVDWLLDVAEAAVRVDETAAFAGLPELKAALARLGEGVG